MARFYSIKWIQQDVIDLLQSLRSTSKSNMVIPPVGHVVI
jgi:protoheme ferro-lyase